VGKNATWANPSRLLGIVGIENLCTLSYVSCAIERARFRHEAGNAKVGAGQVEARSAIRVRLTASGRHWHRVASAESSVARRQTSVDDSRYLAYENDKRSGNPRGSDYAIDHVQRRVVPEIRSAFAPAAEEDSGGDAEFELDAAAAADQVVMKH
jgi:hypothetical protein